MTCRLGSCRADSYRVIIRDRTGPEVVELDFTALQWDRRLDDVSEAVVTIPPGAGCCGKLAEVFPWRHELAISRDGQEASVTVTYLIAETGSDPVIAGVLGLKDATTTGVMDPDSLKELTGDDHTTDAQSEIPRAKALAQAILAKS